MAQVEIINTGVANIRSLQAAFDRLNVPWSLTESVEALHSAPFVVLPGVGAYAPAMEFLEQRGLHDAIVRRTENDLPTLAICLGFQLLCAGSEESPGVAGLGILPYQIKRFDDSVPVPQLGWNDVAPQSAGPITTGSAYFANSFRLVDQPKGWSFATTDYGGRFVSSFWRGNVLACQFHPELSGTWGETVLKNWIVSGRGHGSC